VAARLWIARETCVAVSILGLQTLYEDILAVLAGYGYHLGRIAVAYLT
jgi:hypothetical protein